MRRTMATISLVTSPALVQGSAAFCRFHYVEYTDVLVLTLSGVQHFTFPLVKYAYC
jgi:hypothetical protein